MCGRFTQRFGWRELHELLDLIGSPANLAPRYNVAPGQQVATVRAEDGGRRLAKMRWGLIPSWAKEPGIGYRLINARSETARTKPSFRSAWRSRRCLIPADGFYEWTGEKKARQPWLITMKEGGVFCFAGLWESWEVPAGLELRGSMVDLREGDALETCTILTTAANADISRLHHRMPVILPIEAHAPWLAGDDMPLGPSPPDAMTFHPVSPLVNKAANDDPRCVEPLA
ncbi:MAG: SOS response-associated peptidase [bacterium]|nr:SOS response-associated peptidase [bacterium]